MIYVLNKCLVEDGGGLLGISWHDKKPEGEFKKYQSFIKNEKFLENFGFTNGEIFKVVIYLKNEENSHCGTLEVASKIFNMIDVFDAGYETPEKTQHRDSPL